MNSPAVLSRLLPCVAAICMSTGVVHNVLFGQRARLPLSWLKTCWLSLHIFGHVYSHDCHFIRLRPRLGSFAPNGFLLASIPPHGDTYLSACSQCSCSFLEQHSSACIKKKIIIIIYRTSRCYQIYDIILFFLSASQRYSFGLAASPPHGDIWPCGVPSHSNIRPCGLAPSRRYSALRPRPLTAIFGLAASPPHGNQFSIRLTANVDLFFSCRLTAKSIFYSPHGECRFYFSLTDS